MKTKYKIIILGVILLLSFGYTYYKVEKLANKEAKKQIEKDYSDALIESCRAYDIN